MEPSPGLMVEEKWTSARAFQTTINLSLSLNRLSSFPSIYCVLGIICGQETYCINDYNYHFSCSLTFILNFLVHSILTWIPRVHHWSHPSFPYI